MRITPDEGRRQGEARRDEGVDRAAGRRQWQVRHGTLRFLDAMMKRPNRTATTDDAADDLSRPYADGGRWRGAIPKRLAGEGLIKAVGAIRSARSARHKGLVTRWCAADERGIERKQSELRRWLDENPCPDCDGGSEQLDLFPNRTRKKPGAATRWACN